MRTSRSAETLPMPGGGGQVLGARVTPLVLSGGVRSRLDWLL